MNYADIKAQEEKLFNEAYGDLGQRIIDEVLLGASPEDIARKVQGFIKENIEAQYLRVGNTYKTYDGKDVRIISEQKEYRGYETVCGDDVWFRYNRRYDIGRCTGTDLLFDTVGSIPTHYTIKQGIL